MWPPPSLHLLNGRGPHPPGLVFFNPVGDPQISDSIKKNSFAAFLLYTPPQGVGVEHAWKRERGARPPLPRSFYRPEDPIPQALGQEGGARPPSFIIGRGWGPHPMALDVQKKISPPLLKKGPGAPSSRP